MRRRLFTMLSALSLLLFVAVCVLWVRSYRWREMVAYDHPHPADPTGETRAVDGVGWFRGDFLIGRTTYGDSPSGDGSLRHERMEYPVESYTAWRAQYGGRPLAGFQWLRLAPTPRQPAWEVAVLVVPHWAVLVAASALPASWLWRKIRRRSAGSHGLCPSCGYDLRATPGRCPECGAAPMKASA